MNPVNAIQWYQNNIGNNPMVEIPVLAGAAGLGAYALATPLMEGAANLASMTGNAKVQDSANNYLAPDGDIQKGKRRLALMAAAATAMAGIYSHIDTRSGGQGMLDSLTQKDYWKNNPAASQRWQDSYNRTNPMYPRKSPEQVYLDTYLPKTASNLYDQIALDPTFHDLNIPVGQSINMMRTDPYLLPSNRSNIAGLISSSANGSETSKFNLVSTAIKAGADFSSAYLFGKGVGAILAMPTPMVNHLSTMGGVANAVIGSGILQHI